MSQTNLTELTDSEGLRALGLVDFKVGKFNPLKMRNVARNIDRYTSTAEDGECPADTVYTLLTDDQDLPDTDLGVIYDPTGDELLWDDGCGNWYDKDGNLVYDGGIYVARCTAILDSVGSKATPAGYTLADGYRVVKVDGLSGPDVIITGLKGITFAEAGDGYMKYTTDWVTYNLSGVEQDSGTTVVNTGVQQDVLWPAVGTTQTIQKTTRALFIWQFSDAGPNHEDSESMIVDYVSGEVEQITHNQNYRQDIFGGEDSLNPGNLVEIGNNLYYCFNTVISRINKNTGVITQITIPAGSLWRLMADLTDTRLFVGRRNTTLNYLEVYEINLTSFALEDYWNTNGGSPADHNSCDFAASFVGNGFAVFAKNSVGAIRVLELPSGGATGLSLSSELASSDSDYFAIRIGADMGLCSDFTFCFGG